MSSIESGLYSLLVNSASVNSLVNGSVWFGLMQEQATLPSIVISAIAGGPIVTLESTLATADRRFQFDCYANDYLTGRKVAKAVRQLLQDFSGTLYDGTLVKACVVNLDMDMPYETGGTGLVYRAVLDLSIFYDEQ